MLFIASHKKSHPIKTDTIFIRRRSAEEIETTADPLKAKGYCVFGDEGALRLSSNRDPWVKDGQIIINQGRLDYMDCATHLYQNDQAAYALAWSAPWYTSMAGPLLKISEAQSGDAWGMDKACLSLVRLFYGSLCVTERTAQG